MNLLITGGAGYIGSHAVRKAIDRGHRVTVVDDLSHGHERAIDKRADFVSLSTGDESGLRALIREKKFEAIMHFAAYIEVGESVQDPLKYYENNFSNTLSLLRAACAEDVKKFIFSSTAAVYGNPQSTPIFEDHPHFPINPYGRSKAMVEAVLQDLSSAEGLGSIALRYFNVGGAHPSGEIGEAHEPESHLIPRILEVAQGKVSSLQIYGTDYQTRDGTCVRDYVHVEDLVEAHLLALPAVQIGKKLSYNLGSQQGFTVREVIAAAEAVVGKKLPVEEKPRRAGDPASLIANSDKIRKELGWKPQYSDMKTMIEHAWNWHRSHPRGYES